MCIWYFSIVCKRLRPEHQMYKAYKTISCQTEKRKTSYDIIYTWNLKNDTKELIHKNRIDSQA